MFPKNEMEFYKIMEMVQTMPEMAELQKDIAKIKSEGMPTIKDNKEAECYRQKGNNCFKQRKHYEALREYTASLAFAVENGLEQKLAYANRSALLFHKGYYAECLQDIERALKSSYPENKKAQLIERREKAQKLLPHQVRVPFHGELPQIKQKNPLVPVASDAVKLAYNNKYGRLIKATRNIKMGEILIVEEPYAYITERTYRFKHCYECGELSFNMVACEDCLNMFCSEICREAAYKLYHRYECVVERYFGLYPITSCEVNGVTSIMAMFSDIKLPVKMTIRALFDIKDNKHETMEKGYHTQCYEEVRKLETHANDYVRTHIMKMTNLTAELIKVFHLLTTYTNIKADTKASDKLIKGLLMNNVLVKLGNTFASFARQKTDSAEDEILHRPINEDPLEVMLMMKEETMLQHFGAGIYPVSSLLNHSCNPNVGFIFYGKTLVIRAKRDIEEGQQCFNKYTNGYVSEKRDVRRQKLMANPFFFTCYCRPCKENWPTISNNSCPASKNAEFAYGPSSHTWKYNKEHYNALREYYKLFFFESLPETEYPKYWPKIEALYQKIKYEEPSPSFGFLETIFEKIFFTHNRIVKF